MYSPKAKYIFDLLINSGVIGSTGSIEVNLFDISFLLNDKSSIGNILQEWVGEWLKFNNIYFRPNTNTQEPPDFYLTESDKTDLLEIKVFDADKSPNFDVANFDSYIRSLQHKPWKIDSDYLIIGYSMHNGALTIKDIWLKKVWEITCRSKELPLKCQVKQKKIVNIRPAVWYSNRASFSPFNNREDFLNALNLTIQAYDKVSSAIDKENWLTLVSSGLSNLSDTISITGTTTVLPNKSNALV